MKLPRTGREFYVQKPDPADAAWEASFDGGLTWHAGAAVPGDAASVRWLLEGPAFVGAADPAAIPVTRDTSPTLRTLAGAETLVRQGARVSLVAYGGSTAPLLGPVDLTGFPGAPFSAEVIAAVAEQIRSICGWHVAPTLSETLTVDSDGERTLFLPSLRVVEVTAVRDLTDPNNPKTIDGWTWSEDGMLTRKHGGYWPEGLRALEVDITHGYETCPSDLFPVAADFGRRRVQQESIGGRSVTFVSGAEDDRLGSTLSAYRIRVRP